MRQTKKICYNCGKEMRSDNQYRWHDDFLGEFAIDCQPEEYSYCDCGEEQLAYSLCLRIEQEEQNRISQAIMNMAHNNLERLDELVATSRDLESIMNVSRQAISKNGKLKTLVYHITFKGKIYYLKESVNLFKKKGDGRFDLSPYVNETTTATTMDKSSMNDIKSVETTSLLTDLAPSLTNVLPQNIPESYWEKYNDSFYFPSSLSMKQTAQKHPRSNKDPNGQITRMSYSNSLIFDATTLLLDRTKSINSQIIHIANKGEK